MAIWKVQIGASAEKEIQLLIAKKQLSADDMEVIKAWIEEIQEEGIDAIKDSKFWNDHELTDNWKGHRSSSFSKLGRIIYKIIEKKIIVEVVKITPDHDYRKEG
jgi:mRNA-degrading endonuclease YafQ of YafQ-DinJ toxin-antitoxin module